jgi:hypothetical protein
VWDLLSRIKKIVKPWGVQLLCEVHEDFNLNIELARCARARVCAHACVRMRVCACVCVCVCVCARAGAHSV